MTLPDDIAIQTVALSKKYRIFANARERLKEALDPWGRNFHQDFWALRDINLTVKKGHTVGILGRNGSGKSTLLQLITEVMRPTSGTVAVAGRVTALLELGAGFDPDFSGRENARQFGRLQGMSAREIETRLPDIEDFAGIGEFFDREVKTYSSGMFARLAFAAAINVNPDILILDEILAVGDARFQQKCFRRIQDMRANGCTILFVSHSTEQVLRLCDSAILLNQGRVSGSGATSDVVDAYHQILYGTAPLPDATLPADRPAISEKTTETALPGGAAEFAKSLTSALLTREYYNPNENRLGSKEAEIFDILATANETAIRGVLEGTERLTLWVKVRYEKLVQAPRIGWGIVTAEGIMVSGSNSVSRGVRLPDAEANQMAIYRIDVQLNLCGGEYFINLGVSTYDAPEWHFIDTRRAMLHFSVRNSESASGVTDFPSTCAYCVSACTTPDQGL
jgi:lipopolysaccharide transport system ATP-binding protein